MLVQAAGGIFAGATASCITTPLDTIKTRLQVKFTSIFSISYIGSNKFSWLFWITDMMQCVLRYRTTPSLCS